jgi:hypothetical protein
VVAVFGDYHPAAKDPLPGRKISNPSIGVSSTSGGAKFKVEIPHAWLQLILSGADSSAGLESLLKDRWRNIYRVLEVPSNYRRHKSSGRLIRARDRSS